MDPEGSAPARASRDGAVSHAPDYATDHRVAEGYRSLLEGLCGDRTVRHALPSEVAAWWRQRARSVVSGAGDHWHIEGPAAASGRIGFASAG